MPSMFKEISFRDMKRLYSRRGNAILFLMCFALPLKVKKIEKDPTSLKLCRARMEDGRVVKLGFAGKVKLGDYLICQQDVAVGKLTKLEAQSMRQTIKGVSDELKKRS